MELAEKHCPLGHAMKRVKKLDMIEKDSARWVNFQRVDFFFAIITWSKK